MARQRLPGPIFNYIDGAADDEVTYRRNTAAFEECDLVPSVLQGVQEVDLSTTVLGQKLALPVYCSPTALQRLFHHDGERAVAAAAGKFGTMFGVSSLGHHQPGRGAAHQQRAAGLPVLFPQGPRAQSRDDVACQAGRSAGDDADGGQHHRREPRARQADRLCHSVPAERGRHVAICHQAGLGRSITYPGCVPIAATGKSRRDGPRRDVDQPLFHRDARPVARLGRCGADGAGMGWTVLPQGRDVGRRCQACGVDRLHRRRRFESRGPPTRRLTRIVRPIG